MELKLNIYKGKEIEKTYEADSYDILFGTIEDLLNLFEGVTLNLNDADTLFTALTGMIGTLKPFLKDIFDGLTDEEIRRTKVKELVPLFFNVFKYAIGEIKGISTEKN